MRPAWRRGSSRRCNPRPEAGAPAWWADDAMAGPTAAVLTISYGVASGTPAAGSRGGGGVGAAARRTGGEDAREDRRAARSLKSPPGGGGGGKRPHRGAALRRLASS